LFLDDPLALACVLAPTDSAEQPATALSVRMAPYRAWREPLGTDKLLSCVRHGLP
jgi:hypothetical protein